MTWFDHLSLRLKLTLAPALCLLMLGLSAAGALWGFAQQRAALDARHENSLPSHAFAAKVDQAGRDVAQAPSTATSAQTAIAAAAVLAVVVGLALSLGVARAMLRRMAALSQGVAAIAAGDLGSPLRPRGATKWAR